MKQFLVQKDHLFIIANQGKFQKSILIEASLKAAKRDTLYPYNSTFAKNYSLSELKKTEIPQENTGLMEISEISAEGKAYYFWSSSFDQKNLKRNTQFYKYNSSKIESLDEINYVLEQQTKRNSNIIINHFSVNPQEEMSLLFHKGAQKEELFFLKVNKHLEVINQYTASAENYLDFNKMIVLDENTQVVLNINQQKLWSFLYKTNENKLLKEITTSIEESFYPMKLKKLEDGKLIVLFSNFKGKSLVSVIED